MQDDIMKRIARLERRQRHLHTAVGLLLTGIEEALQLGVKALPFARRRIETWRKESLEPVRIEMREYDKEM